MIVGLEKQFLVFFLSGRLGKFYCLWLMSKNYKFLFLFSNKMLVIKAGIHKMLFRIPNREYPEEAV